MNSITNVIVETNGNYLEEIFILDDSLRIKREVNASEKRLQEMTNGCRSLMGTNLQWKLK